MVKPRKPRNGSMQFWPRKRSRHSFVRVRSWANAKESKPLGFVGYKAGMTHVMLVDSRAKSNTHNEKIAVPVTIVETPEMFALGAAFYTKDNRESLRKVADVFAKEVPKDWRKIASKRVPLAKKTEKSVSDVAEFDVVRLIVCSKPSATTVGAKKPQVIELAVGGDKDSALAFVSEKLGKEIAASEVFTAGDVIDVHAVTKGKGFQGTVKRYGVPLGSHKAEKVKRGVAAMGAWTPKRVDYTIPQPGKMGYHQRSEYNKQIVKMFGAGEAENINPSAGLHKYGVIKNNFLLIKGSIAGPRKKAVLLTAGIRNASYKNKSYATAPEVTYISTKDFERK